MFRALEEIESTEMDLETAVLESAAEVARQLLKTVAEFHTYIRRRGGLMNDDQRLILAERLARYIERTQRRHHRTRVSARR